MRAAILVILAFVAFTQAAPSCSAWCAILFSTNFTTQCGTNTPNFASEDNCNFWCNASSQLIPVGTDADQNGNTLGCRIYHAGVAAGSTGKTVHCDHASMMGGGLCGTYCESYCQNMMYGPCAGMYSSYAVCNATCQTFPTTPTNGGSDITANDQAKWDNDVQCRDYHGGWPATQAKVHCAHAWVTGGAACGKTSSDLCTGYCQTYVTACAGRLESGVTDVATCVTACQNAMTTKGASFSDTVATNWTATTGDTIVCRAYHATAAFVDAALHCPHAYVAAAAGTPCGPPSTASPTPTTTSSTTGVAGVFPALALLIFAVASKFF